MPTLMQKIRLGIRGWQRRREESEKEFLTRNASWAAATPVAAAAPAKSRTFAIDMDGLTVAYLDDSGQLAHFLDTSDGEIVDVRIAESAAYPEPRYRRVPSRTPNADAEDRRARRARAQQRYGFVSARAVPRSHARTRLVQLPERSCHRGNRSVDLVLICVICG